MTNMRRAVGYVRVSTTIQSDGASLPAQEAKIRALAALCDAELTEVVVDTESGKDLNRPGVQHVLGLVRQRAVEVVLVSKMDRLSRSIRDMSDLMELFERHKVRLCSAAENLDTSNAGGRLVLSVLAAFAQWEREMIAERTREAMGHMRSTGRYTGNAPFGCRLCRDGQHVEPDAAETKILQIIRRWRSNGKSLRRIAADLNVRGFRTRVGSEWRQEYVRRVLKVSTPIGRSPE